MILNYCVIRDDDEIDNNDNDEDFSQGINSFILNARHRRSRHQQLPITSLSAEDVGIENRLVAAATFEKTFV
jgi:hypothetical protein